MRLQIRDCRWQIGAVAIAWTLSALLAGTARAETIDRLLAVVGGRPIMLSDVTTARELGLEQVAEGAADPIGAVLDRLIDRELMLVEVERYAPPDPAGDAIDRELGVVRARFGSAEAFAAALAHGGINQAQLREAVRDTLRIRAYFDQRFTGAATEARRQALIAEWIAGLRRRANLTNLYGR